MIRQRFVALLPAVVLALPTSASASTPVDTGADDVTVTAVVQQADGSLEFRSTEATSAAAGRSLAVQWDRQPAVVAASVEQPVRAFSLSTADPLEANQWGLQRLRSAEVHGLSTGAGQIVAIVDTGVDGQHPDLAGVLLPGKDFINPANTTSVDPNGHGTHIAGVVAAVPGNGLGGSGLAPGAKVLPVRALRGDGGGVDGDVARGIVWAVDHGAGVVNLSLGGPSPSPLLDTAIRYARDRNVIVVVAAGNEGDQGDPILYPAASAGVLAVGAIGVNGVQGSFSSTGDHLDFAAPGVRVASTYLGGGYATLSGTSMAAPWVAASVALLRSAQPGLSAAAVSARLTDTAEDLGPTGADRVYGAGLVNPLAALRVGAGPATAPGPGPVPAPAEPAPAPLPAAAQPAAVPAPLPAVPAVTAPAPTAGPAGERPVPASALSLRLTASASTVTSGSAVGLSARASSTGLPAARIPVVLELRSVDGAWTAVQSGSTSAGGVASWTARPAGTSTLRVRSGGTVSGSVQIVVRQQVRLAVRRTAGSVRASGAVLPGGRATVRLEVRSAAGWVLAAQMRTRADGGYVFTRRLAAGSVVRVVVNPRSALLGGSSSPTRS